MTMSAVGNPAVGGGTAPIATTTTPGIVMPDGTTILVAPTGKINVPIATNAVPGLVQTDGTSVFMTGSVLSAHGATIATPTTAGIVKPDGTIITVDGTGLITVPKCSHTAFGVCETDGTSITAASGVISATPPPIATAAANGVVHPDGTIITVDGTGLITVPKASAAVFGVAEAGTNINVSGGVLSVNTATSGQLGLVQPDGTSILVSSGNISVPTATSTVLGLVKPDGTTIQNTAGAISARIATPTLSGIVIPDGVIITVDGFGHITVPKATASIFGVVEPDGSTITASGGVLTAATATSSTLGIVEPDNTTITISGGVISAVGGSGALTLLQTLSPSGVNSVTSNSLPQSYTHLMIVLDLTLTAGLLQMRFNGDTGARYAFSAATQTGATAGSLSSTGATIFQLNPSGQLIVGGNLTLPRYSVSQVHHRLMGVLSNSGTLPTVAPLMISFAGLYAPSAAAAITTITIFGSSTNTITGTISIYGMS